MDLAGRSVVGWAVVKPRGVVGLLLSRSDSVIVAVGFNPRLDRDVIPVASATVE